MAGAGIVVRGRLFPEEFRPSAAFCFCGATLEEPTVPHEGQGCYADAKDEEPQCSRRVVALVRLRTGSMSQGGSFGGWRRPLLSGPSNVQKKLARMCRLWR